jgi:hypothetical protein|uniref:Replication factor C C-terminal domain-containing protein n=1 Tax=viral metagenome TaxID=1070528 RepID=A0A6C0M487_9ZZZZ
MKIPNHFETYVEAVNSTTLHPKLKTIYETAFPSNINHLPNLIFYGPSGTGKYSQVLACISKYSPTHLKYEKRLSVTLNKEIQTIKISDIHFEIDMSLLGCTSKLWWNEIHTQIVDVVSARPETVGIIVCKYFHNIHSELLETFYNYMHMPHHSNIRLKYVLITEHIGFIPNNILNSCEIISVARPTSTMYKKILPAAASSSNPASITNIQMLKLGNEPFLQNAGVQELFDNLLNYVCNVEQIRFTQMRELLYDILIYDFDINEFAWHLISELKKRGMLRDDDMSSVLIHTHKFLQYYNNNYRPIYHLENFVFMLVNIICANRTKMTCTQPK